MRVSVGKCSSCLDINLVSAQNRRLSFYWIYLNTLALSLTAPQSCFVSIAPLEADYLPFVGTVSFL